MSMISMQVDRLRDRAMRVEIFLEGSTDAIPTDTHEQLREAADTIWQLRNDCVELRNEKENLTRLLREALEKKFSDEDDLRAENAKLREVMADDDA